MNKLLFFTAVDNGYECFIPLYVYFANKYNENSSFEFLVRDLDEKFEKLMNEFCKVFNVNIKLRNFDSKIQANSFRFLEEPEIKCEYTYIGDVDIFINENILPFHLEEIKKYGTIYDNKIRLNDNSKLSGLHFVKTLEWYKATKEVRNSYLNKIIKFNNEQLLKKVAFESKIKILDNVKENSFTRPIHGLHISLKRVPFTDKMTFPIDLFNSMIVNGLYLSDDYQKLKPFLSEKMLNILLTCENYCKSH